MQAKFNVGDKVVVLFKKQRGEVVEVIDCSPWPFRYKVRTAVNHVTLDEHYLVVDQTIVE